MWSYQPNFLFDIKWNPYTLEKVSSQPNIIKNVLKKSLITCFLAIPIKNNMK